ncbi:hypothetical protein SFRURICE_005794, partial [Spodoptera frugiperda]
CCSADCIPHGWPVVIVDYLKSFLIPSVVSTLHIPTVQTSRRAHLASLVTDHVRYRHLPASSEMTSRIFHKSGVREARSIIKGTCCSADCIPHGWPVVIVDYLNSFLMVDSMQLKTKAVSGRRGVCCSADCIPHWWPVVIVDYLKSFLITKRCVYTTHPYSTDAAPRTSSQSRYGPCAVQTCCSADCILHGWPVVIVDYLNSFLMVDLIQLKTKAVSRRRRVLLKTPRRAHLASLVTDHARYRHLPASSEMTSRIFHKSGVREARSVIKVAAVLTVYLTGGR